MEVHWKPPYNHSLSNYLQSAFFLDIPSRAVAVPCLLIATIAVGNSNLTDQHEPFLHRAMERAYALSPTPTVTGDEADFRKYLDDGGNKLAVDLEKGVCIRTLQQIAISIWKT